MKPSISRRRLLGLGSGLGLGGLTLAGRVGYMQTVEYERYVQMARDEHWGILTMPAQRGAILDRGGNPLAMSITTFRILVDPAKVPPDKLGRLANVLAPSLKLTPLQVASVLAAPGGIKVLAEDLPYETGRNLQQLAGFPGLIIDPVTRRSYPEGNLAAQLIGFVGRDGAGLSGIEADYNTELAGKPGKLTYERDSTGAEIPLGVRDNVSAEHGANLILTIDRYIQRVSDAEADAAMIRHKADAVTIVVMEPDTGGILAMASRPSFNLVKPDFSTEEKRALIRNRPVTDMYEPGSTFKVLTMAAALEEKLVTPNSTYVDNGSVMKWDRRIVNWDGGANGVTNMTQLLVKSANVGAVWLSDRLGPERMYRYVRDFGFGQPTNIDLGGEAAGQAKTPKDSGWSPFDLATNSFGQGINVTPVQMITALATIANGGRLMQPRVVRELQTAKGNRTFKPVVVRRVMSEQTAATLREMMVTVVFEGASKAIVPGYRTSGKSGTTQITVGGTYSDDQTIATFVQFLPENPPFIVLVRVDRPKDVQWGGQVAGPIAKTITEKLLAYYRIPPNDPNARV